MNKLSRLALMIKCRCRLIAVVKDGDRIIINHAVPLVVKADGKERTLYTTERTVQAAIDQANISVRSQDKVYPSLDTSYQTGYDDYCYPNR